jgi:hypothetical protein
VLHGEFRGLLIEELLFRIQSTVKTSNSNHWSDPIQGVHVIGSIRCPFRPPCTSGFSAKMPLNTRSYAIISLPDDTRRQRFATVIIVRSEVALPWQHFMQPTAYVLYSRFLLWYDAIALQRCWDFLERASWLWVNNADILFLLDIVKIPAIISLESHTWSVC